MTKCVVWIVSAAILFGFLTSPCRVEATRVPALRWNSGDHDIYQTCDRTPPPTISGENNDARPCREPASTRSGPMPEMIGRSDFRISVFQRTIVWFGDLLIW